MKFGVINLKCILTSPDGRHNDRAEGIVRCCGGGVVVDGADVPLEVVLVGGDVVAQVAGETSALVHSFYVNPEMALLCGNVGALLADVAPAQVNLLLVQLQPVLCF